MAEHQEDILPILQQIPFLQSLSTTQLEELAAHVEVRRYRPGARLLLEGTYGSRFLILRSGEIVILKRLGSSTIELARKHPISFLGEMALVEESMRSASARAVSECEVLELSKAAFSAMILNHPSIALALARELSAHLRRTDTLLIEGLIAKNKEMTQAQQRLEQAYNATLAALGDALDLRDTETQDHSRRVAELAVIIGSEMGLPEAELKALWRGALIHDVGKIGVPDHILYKPGPLTTDDWRLMVRHPEWGARILARVEFLADALPVVLYHHEWFDGSGYPAKLAGEAIPLIARIFAVADSFDALTSDRPYRAALTPKQARVEIQRQVGTHFDPAVVAAFESVFDQLVAVCAPPQ